MSDRLAELLVIYKSFYPELGLDRDEACELAGMLLAKVERLTAELEGKNHTRLDQLESDYLRQHAEVERLEAQVASLQPKHHYMTKFGAELQADVTRLHDENNQLRAAAKEQNGE